MLITWIESRNRIKVKIKATFINGQLIPGYKLELAENNFIKNQQSLMSDVSSWELSFCEFVRWFPYPPIFKCGHAVFGGILGKIYKTLANN